MNTIIKAIQNERDFQKRKGELKGWNPNHAIGEFILIMEEELSEAKKAYLKCTDKECLSEILQVITVGVACLEEHGVFERDSFNLEEQK